MDIQEVLGMGAGWEVGGDTAGTPTDPYSLRAYFKTLLSHSPLFSSYNFRDNKPILWFFNFLHPI